MKKNDHLPTFRKKKSRKKPWQGLVLLSPVVALFCLITAVYVVSYYENSSQKEKKEENTIVQAGKQEKYLEDNAEEKKDDMIENILKQENEFVENTLKHEERQNEQQVLPVDDTTDIYITPRMSYTLEIYDTRSNQLTKEILPIPNDMYGLNRAELEQYLIDLAEKENNENSEVDSHYQLTLFSRREFTVRLTITEKEPEYTIFLIAEEGWLTAYTGDRTEVFEELHIALGDFPLEQQTMLIRGIYMRTLTDYYDFLETYSS